MPLNILPKKSWHVGNAKNLERVARDRDKEAAKEREKFNESSTLNLTHLRSKHGVEEPYAHMKSSSSKGVTTNGGVRLGEGSIEVSGSAGNKKPWGPPTEVDGAMLRAAIVKDAPRRVMEDPLTHIRKTLGQVACVVPLKREREEVGAAGEREGVAAKKPPSLEELRRERLAREAVESVKAERLMLRIH